MDSFDDRLDEFVNDQVDALGVYTWALCGDEHVAYELAFKWPDLATARKLATADEPDDRIAIDGRTFVRGTLRVPIEGQDGDFAIGLWARLDAPDHGTIANQHGLLAPLLGARARVIAGEPGFRPTFELVDHPLGDLQRAGVDAETAARWRSTDAHFGEPQAEGEPFEAALAVHGWELLDADAAGRTPFVGELEPGDIVKISVRITTIDPSTGEPVNIKAGWWLAVDLVEGDVTSGTLHSVPKLPTTLCSGTRMWPRRDQIFERSPRS